MAFLLFNIIVSTYSTHIHTYIFIITHYIVVVVVFVVISDALAKSLTDLMALVKLLREDIAHQRQEIVYLRNLLENCAGCKEHSNNIQIEITCRTANPCYPGKKCDLVKKIVHLGQGQI